MAMLPVFYFTPPVVPGRSRDLAHYPSGGLKAWGMTGWLRRPPALFSADPGHALRRRVFASHGIGNARSDLCAGIFGGRAHGLRLGGSTRGAAGGSAIERDADFAAKLIYAYGRKDQYG